MQMDLFNYGFPFYYGFISTQYNPQFIYVIIIPIDKKKPRVGKHGKKAHAYVRNRT